MLGMIDQSGADGAPGATYDTWLLAGEFRLQWCTSCAKQIFYPRTLCPHCGSVELEWRPSSGTGRVYSTTVVRQRPDRGGDYNVAIVELDEGTRMISQVIGVPPAEVRIGMPVSAEIATREDGPLVLFRAVA